MNLQLGTIAASLFVPLLITVTSLSGQTSAPTADPSAPGAADVSAALQWTTTTTIGQIVADRPQAARIFELVDIDYCCGGQTSLGDAALAKHISVDRLLAALFAVGAPARESKQRNWQEAGLGELMDHIVTRHHTWLRRELPSLVEVTKTVHRVHIETHPELKQVAAIVKGLPDAILPHLKYEEQIVFPALRELANGTATKNVASLLDELHTDHDDLGEQLHQLRKLTNGFSVPDDACAKYKSMLTGLRALERDLHIHVHLENNVLLPRAIKLLASTDNR